MLKWWLAAVGAVSVAGCGGGGVGTGGGSASVPMVSTPVSLSVPVPLATAGTSATGATSSNTSTTGATANIPPAPAGAPLQPTASGAYGDQFGSLPYVLYVSSRAKHPFALVVALHDCSQTPADLEATSRWFEDAEVNGYAVVMPSHGSDASNPAGCWSYGSDNARGRGLASTLAGLARSVQQLDGADVRRTYVTGFGSGAAQAIAEATAYPDSFASIGAVAAPASGDPVAAGKAAYAQDPVWTRPVPAMLVQGDADTVVPPQSLYVALTTLATMDDGFTSGGAFPGAFTASPSVPAAGTLGGFASFEYTAASGALGWIVVRGAGHVWPGVDATARLRQFFSAHAL